MGISTEKFIKTNLKYNSGIAVDEYKGEFSLASAIEGKDGKLYLRWVYPQGKDRKPSEKTIPHKITLGNKQQAIQYLEQCIYFIETWDKGDDDQPF